MTGKLSIGTIAQQGVALVSEVELRDALNAVYASPLGLSVTTVADELFQKLTSQQWGKDTLCRFLSGWQATHCTSPFVSGLMIRLHREALQSSEPTKELIFNAAGEIGEIIPEDVGLADTAHNERFAAFANSLVGDDSWKLDCYQLPACVAFRDYVRQGRLFAPIEDAILITAASENWNSGEYTYFDRLVRGWMTKILGHSVRSSEKAVGYVSVHAGETELGHFLHALNAWRFYCKAVEQMAEPEKAQRVFEVYLAELHKALAELSEELLA